MTSGKKELPESKKKKDFGSYSDENDCENCFFFGYVIFCLVSFFFLFLHLHLVVDGCLQQRIRFFLLVCECALSLVLLHIFFYCYYDYCWCCCSIFVFFSSLILKRCNKNKKKKTKHFDGIRKWTRSWIKTHFLMFFCANYLWFSLFFSYLDCGCRWICSDLNEFFFRMFKCLKSKLHFALWHIKYELPKQKHIESAQNIQYSSVGVRAQCTRWNIRSGASKIDALPQSQFISKRYGNSSIVMIPAFYSRYERHQVRFVSVFQLFAFLLFFFMIFILNWRSVFQYCWNINFFVYLPIAWTFGCCLYEYKKKNRVK